MGCTGVGADVRMEWNDSFVYCQSCTIVRQADGRNKDDIGNIEMALHLGSPIFAVVVAKTMYPAIMGELIWHAVVSA
eukprot:2404477-Ditylum_brightwellii.AAC.2